MNNPNHTMNLAVYENAYIPGAEVMSTFDSISDTETSPQTIRGTCDVSTICVEIALATFESLGKGGGVSSRKVSSD